MSLIYLASPYTHDDPWVRHDRYEQTLMAYVTLLKQGLIVFAPIVHTHYADRMLGRTKDHAFWMRQATEFLHRSDAMRVLMLDGWNRSKGVAAEIVDASRLGIPVSYMEWPQSMPQEQMGG